MKKRERESEIFMQKMRNKERERERDGPCTSEKELADMREDALGNSATARQPDVVR